jgi:hypothetical protein
VTVTTYTLDATGTACGQAPRRLSLDQAHMIMQQHSRCTAIRCQQRKAALALLVQTGQYVLADQA